MPTELTLELEKQIEDFFTENPDLRIMDSEEVKKTKKKELSAEDTIKFAIIDATGSEAIGKLLRGEIGIDIFGKVASGFDFTNLKQQEIFNSLIYFENQGLDKNLARIAEHIVSVYRRESADTRELLERCWGSESQSSMTELLEIMRDLPVDLAEFKNQHLSFNESEAAQLAILRLLPIKTVGKNWYIYEKGSWNQIKNRDQFRPVVLDVLHPSHRTAWRADNVMDQIQGYCQVPEETLRGFNLEVENGTIFINAMNGIIEISPSNDYSIRLLEHSPELNFTKKIATSYDPNASCSLFDRLLQEQLSDPKDQHLIQLFCGNILLPHCRFETALVCYGQGGTGKSTIAEGITNVLGASLISRIGIHQICDSKGYSLPLMEHMAVNLSVELNALEVNDSGNFKTLVSGEPIEVRAIYGAPKIMRTSCKIWALSNNLPAFKFGSSAEQRRLRIIHFDKKPQVVDIGLKDRLKEESSGIFAWMMRGLIELLKVGVMPQGSDSSLEAFQRFEIQNDPVAAFVKRCCTLGADEIVPKAALKQAYASFCEEHGLSAFTPDWFFRRLLSQLPQLKEVQRRLEGQKVRMYQGISVHLDLDSVEEDF